MKAAVSGFRHGHITSIVEKLKNHPDVEITACCERNPGECAGILEKCAVEITHGDFDRMLREADFEILAIGDVYAKRGAQAAKAAEAGKHIVSDKPLCTRKEELEKIKKFSTVNGTSVIIALTLRYGPAVQTARKLIREGTIGTVTNVIVTGHHGLMFRSGRPDWYFEEGMHGGTVNDLMVHGIDAVPWMTGCGFSEILSVLTGHFEPGEAPFFEDIAKAFLKMENGAGVFIDSSYKAPAGHPSGWEFHLWGTEGSMHFKTSGRITVKKHNRPEVEITPETQNKTDFIQDLLNEIKKTPGYKPVLTTAECLDSTEKTIAVQEAAGAPGSISLNAG